MGDRFKRLEIRGEKKTPAPPGEEPREFDADHYFGEAEERYWRGDFEGALRDYSRALREQIHHPGAWAGQLRCLLELEELEEVILWARRAEEKIGISAEVLALRGLALHLRQQTEQAMGLLDTAMAQREQARLVWIARGEVVLDGSERNAKFCFLKALEGEPDFRIHAWIGRAYERGGRHQQALDQYRKALGEGGGRVWIWYRAGRCYEELGLTGRATQAFEQALRLRPGYAEAQEDLASIARQGWIRRRLHRLRVWLRR